MENSDRNKSKKKPVSSKTETVSEPAIVYRKEANSKKIIFSSIQDQDQDNYRYWLSQTPEERLASVTRLIREIFAEELEKPSNNRIIFD